MMDHIINFDWNYREPEEYFIKPEDLDNSVTERILRNKFRDPLISSDEEEDNNRPLRKIDWDKVFSESQQNERRHRFFVPGLNHPPVQYLKLSALTAQQHQQCLKVISAQYPHVLPMGVVLRPSKTDLQTFEEVKEVYEKEQQEFIEWAKMLWTNDHCRRALRPKPRVETVYEARFKIKAAEMESFPKTLHVAAQIPLETMNNDVFEIVHKEDLITVNIDELPQVEFPIRITERLSIMKPFAIPEPCPKHPCKFILPTEKHVTTKSLREVHRSLAQYASERGAAAVLAEGAARCLLQHERPWTLPVSVVEGYGADGEPCNVIVLGSELAVSKEAAPMRTYRAFRQMLDIALVPYTEMSKLMYSNIDALRISKDATKSVGGLFEDPMNVCEDSSDDEDNMMIIEADEDDDLQASSSKVKKPKEPPNPTNDNNNDQPENTENSEEGCTCKGNLFENPPPRSYRKWRLRNCTTNHHIDVIIHCSHKLKVQGGSELVLEPVPEYQPELAGSAQPDGTRAGLALACLLRRNVTIANVRVDGSTGDVVTCESYSIEPELRQRAANVLHSALASLRGLLPGVYVLRHEPSHGANALLYAGGGGAGAGEPLTLQTGAPPDEARAVRTPPRLAPVLLPLHKYRKILPLAFTYNPHHVAPEPRRPAARQKTPPQALQWPKKKGRKRKKRQQ